MKGRDLILDWAMEALPEGVEREHPASVRRLALKIFDDLSDLHGLGAKSRAVLELASLLHDVGLSRGEAGHHKSSYEMIMAMELPLTGKGPLVAAAARYHRKALPSKDHRAFRRLSKKDRRRLLWIAGILRLADALDADRKGSDRKVRCSAMKDRVVMTLGKPVSPTVMMALERKKDLFVLVSGRSLIVRWL
ncbi:MAG: HD domain-containing protein [Thermanaerothrix sp.]|nr:HD domain-containing protein [Thermanaerothrix sp.]